MPNRIISDPNGAIKALTDYGRITASPGCIDQAAELSRTVAQVWRTERESVLPVLNAAANNIDANLKRVAIMQETVRAFAARLLPFRAFATSFTDVPLQGTDEVVVAYYPLQAAASSNFVEANGYVFDQATNTQTKKITVNKRKYQPLDYSSQEFARQPWFNTAQLGKMNAERLALDIIQDVLSVVTLANFGAAAKTAPAPAYTSDDVVDVATVCTDAMWPEIGRSLIVNTALDNALKKDPSYKLALNIGGTEVIRDGKIPKIGGFDYYAMPGLPANGENLLGFAAFASAIGAAFAPVNPAAGVRQQLVGYQVATDAQSGISLNYRHWGAATADRDFQVIESAYGYEALVPAALKRLTHP